MGIARAVVNPGPHESIDDFGILVGRHLAGLTLYVFVIAGVFLLFRATATPGCKLSSIRPIMREYTEASIPL